MQFAAPLWLLGLLPWAVLTIWMLRRQRSTTAVSFLHFWPTNAISAVKNARFGRPPISIVFLLASIALAIIAAARPQHELKPIAAVESPMPDVSITALAAAVHPHPQVMVTIETHHFDRSSVDVVIRSDDQSITRSITVSPDETQTTFIDFPKLGPMITATVADSSITLQRNGNGVRLADDAHPPEPLRRLIELYRPDHPGDGMAISVDRALPTDRPGIVLAPATADARGPWTVLDDPITRDIDWSALSGGCVLTPGWQPLVFRGDAVLIARRTTPAKQILTSVATSDWLAMPSFVVFWSNALDFLAGGNGEYQSIAPRAQPQIPVPQKKQSEARDWSPFIFLSSIACILLSALYTVRHVQAR
ncbi:MAG: hypothetical protein JO353_05810 [Phycisphaerae bacterium]|nr:hypothetical protein [Phycisphaerae bacterium]